jgi:hypothetical protein
MRLFSSLSVCLQAYFILIAHNVENSAPYLVVLLGKKRCFATCIKYPTDKYEWKFEKSGHIASEDRESFPLGLPTVTFAIIQRHTPSH